MTRRRIIYNEPALELDEQIQSEEPNINIVKNKEKLRSLYHNNYIWIFFIIIIVVLLFSKSNFKY